MGVRRLTGTDRLVLASHNAGKLREIRDLVAPHGLTVSSASELGLPEPEETGASFQANAELKALAAAKATGLPALSDDSGLAVDALGGDPGIYSARWAEDADGTRDFARAMRNVEEALQGKGAFESEQRGAEFVSALCLAWPDSHCDTFLGVVRGEIIWPPRGDQGFGYDPMFLPVGETITFGEMTPREKHGPRPDGQVGLSHRARAFALFQQHCLDG